ncbi:unnamed protein product [Protopolystoma xenopodis]|uniref:Uncharacterized protein n=1 Tax=Protopolystoma xenopodis TaxID=117903 RepID=A0A448XPE6_9PLAT|nr:unnamed protein product [Protopolystoma xenopodis]
MRHGSGSASKKKHKQDRAYSTFSNNCVVKSASKRYLLLRCSNLTFSGLSPYQRNFITLFPYALSDRGLAALPNISLCLPGFRYPLLFISAAPLHTNCT